MELEKINDAWRMFGTIAWRGLDKEQQQNIINWFKTNLGADFGGSMVRYAMLFGIMSCPEEVRIPHCHLTKTECAEKPKHIGITFRVFNTEEEKEQSDAEYLRQNYCYIPFYGEEPRKFLDKYLEDFDGYLYHVVGMDGNIVQTSFGESTYAKAGTALGEAIKRTTMWFYSSTGFEWKTLQGIYRESEIDWFDSKPIAVAKLQVIGGLTPIVHAFCNEKLAERIIKSKQEDDFRDFLTTI